MKKVAVRLFKYLAEERVSFLRDGLIRFSQPQVFNDPFELKPIFTSFGSEKHFEVRIREDFDEIVRDEYEAQSAEFKAAISFSAFRSFAEQKRPLLVKGVTKLANQLAPAVQAAFHKGFEKHVGVLSLTEEPASLLMWAHYANSHQGFVVEFDSEHGFFDQRKSESDELRHLQRVQYSASRPSLTLSQISAFGDLLQKSEQWAYEREWRMLVALKHADSVVSSTPCDVCLFKVPFSAIKGVQIGARASEATSRHIAEALNGNPELQHVQVWRMEVSDRNYELLPKKQVI